MVLGALWLGYRIVNTRIEEEFISQPQLSGTLKIPWSQVEKVNLEGLNIAVHGKGEKIIVGPLMYSNADEIPGRIAQLVEQAVTRGS